MATQQEIAEHIDLSARRVRDLIKGGILPPSKGPSGFDVEASRLAYINYLRGVSTGQVREEVGEVADDNDYQNLIDIEKHRKLKRENDIDDSLVAPVSLLTLSLEQIAAQVVPILDSLPMGMKRENPKLTANDIQLAKKAIAKCRNSIADIRIVVDE